MPTVAEDALWQAVKEKQFSGLQGIIEGNPSEDLVNIPHASNGRTFIMHIIQFGSLLKDKKPYDLINYLIHHPNVNWGFKNARTNETLVDAVLEAIVTDRAILGYLIDVPAVLGNGSELTYETVVKKLNSSQRCYDSDIAAGKASDKSRVDSLQALLSAIRDLTILHAIKTDDEVLFGRLKEIGADPSAFLGDLGDNKLPSFLLKDSNIKLKAWYKEQRRLNSTELSVSSVSLFDNLGKLEKLKAAADDINSAHATREAALLEQAAAEREARMSAAVTSPK